jgi:hypothetical protein
MDICTLALTPRLHAKSPWSVPSLHLTSVSRAMHVFMHGACMFPSAHSVQTQLGAPLWLSFVVVAWGTCAAAMAWMRTPAQFLLLRLVLGVFEAGTFPGIWCGQSQRLLMHTDFP